MRAGYPLFVSRMAVLLYFGDSEGFVYHYPTTWLIRPRDDLKVCHLRAIECHPATVTQGRERVLLSYSTVAHARFPACAQSFVPSLSGQRLLCQRPDPPEKTDLLMICVCMFDRLYIAG
jgi:hypothetical protein